MLVLSSINNKTHISYKDISKNVDMPLLDVLNKIPRDKPIKVYMFDNVQSLNLLDNPIINEFNSIHIFNHHKLLKKEITLYTDGSCLDLRFGGWAFVSTCDIKVFNSEDNTSNNRMELKAVIESLKFLDTRTKVILYSDSQYVVNGVNQWSKAWIKKNFKGVKNPDLWIELLNLLKNFNYSLNWVKAHSTNRYNNLADELANKCAKELKERVTKS